MASLLIRNGHVITAGDSFEGDILVVDGKIHMLGKHLDVFEPEAEVIDASGLYVLPGGIDAHVHMEQDVGGGMVSADDFETGTRAAIAGGTTSIIDFVTPGPGQSLIEALRERKEAAKKSLCDYGLHMSITSWNRRTAEEMRQCVEQEGINSFKVYMAYKETVGLDDRDILAVMDAAAKLGARVTIHCENGDVVDYLQKKFIAEGKTTPKYHLLSRPPEVELEAVQRALLMADVTGCPLYIVHLSTTRALMKVMEAVGKDMDVKVETCPHYLELDKSEYNHSGFDTAAYVMSPPLRSEPDNVFLWEALGDGKIQVVATDHCPFNMVGQKERGIDDFTRIPNGVAGVENRMALLYTFGVMPEKITLNQWVAVTSTAPARIFGLHPRKGTISQGADADLLLWNPRVEGIISAETHHHNCDTNIYENFETAGEPYMVILNGKVAYKNGEFKIDRGAGKYIYRK